MDERRARDDAANGLLEERVSALEAAVGRFASEVRTRRLAVLDEAGGERLVAEVSEGVALFSLLFATGKNSSDGLLIFAAPPVDSFPAGCGAQVWRTGDVVGFLEWWEGDRTSGPVDEAGQAL